MKTVKIRFILLFSLCFFISCSEKVDVQEVYPYLPYRLENVPDTSKVNLKDLFNYTVKAQESEHSCKKMRGGKRKIKLTFGKLTLFFKKENPSGIDGFELTVEATNQVMANFMAFDDLMFNNCLLIEAERNRPTPNYKYLLELMKYQNDSFRNYMKFSNRLSSANNEEEVKKAIDESEDDYKELDEINPKPDTANNNPS